jgi:dihydroorotase
MSPRSPFSPRRGPGSLVIAGGRVIDPASGLDGTADVVVSKGRVERIETERRLSDRDIDQAERGVLDARGKVVAPGFVDLHVHLREPGREDEETVVTGSQAAVAGGFTTVCCMPNTDPAIDSQEVVQFILRQAESAYCRVFPIAAITRDRKGEVLTEMGELKRAGAVALSDDGAPVEKAVMMRRALQYAKQFGLPVASHCEEMSLSAGGAMHEGFTSTRAGLRGIPALAEELIVARDIDLAAETGGHVHLCHLSTARSVALVRDAKKRDVRITAEATPHHFSLTDDLIPERYDTNLKVNPPVRTAQDVKAVIKGLQDGTIDCIATDHAPHAREEKELEFDQAPFGLIGLETALAVSLSSLVRTGRLSLPELLALLTYRPAAVFGLAAGRLAQGSAADLCVFDPDPEVRFAPGAFYSKSQNSPFVDRPWHGVVHQTLVDGHIVFDRRLLSSD